MNQLFGVSVRDIALLNPYPLVDHNSLLYLFTLRLEKVTPLSGGASPLSPQ